MEADGDVDQAETDGAVPESSGAALRLLEVVAAIAAFS
jgi:hypothetical protein